MSALFSPAPVIQCDPNGIKYTQVYTNTNFDGKRDGSTLQNKFPCLQTFHIILYTGKHIDRPQKKCSVVVLTKYLPDTSVTSYQMSILL